MTKKAIPKEEIIQYLRLQKVVQTSKLAEHFNCSKKTIFRILKVPGYITSYNLNSSGITLPSIPKFDDNDLWEHQGFRFSSWRNLKETIQQLVTNSEAGMTAGELQKLLHTNIYHHLTSCVEIKMIFRDPSWKFPIYYSSDYQRRQEQKKARDLIIQELPPQKPPYISKDKIIQILVVALKHHITSVERIMPILESEGIRISERNVKWVFKKYQIEKKGSP